MTLLQDFQREQDKTAIEFFAEITYAFDGNVEIPYWHERFQEFIRNRDSALLKRIGEEVEKIIQEERYAGAPYALNEVIKLLA